MLEEVIRQLVAREVTIAEIAAATGIHEKTIQNVYRTRHDPQYSTVKKIHDFFTK